MTTITLLLMVVAYLVCAALTGRLVFDYFGKSVTHLPLPYRAHVKGLSIWGGLMWVFLLVAVICLALVFLPVQVWHARKLRREIEAKTFGGAQ